VKDGATHLIVVCDTLNHDDYPVYVQPDEDAMKKASACMSGSMQRVVEVYNLSMSKEDQLAERRAFNINY
jgi:hypothetical protein